MRNLLVFYVCSLSLSLMVPNKVIENSDYYCKTTGLESVSWIELDDAITRTGEALVPSVKYLTNKKVSTKTETETEQKEGRKGKDKEEIKRLICQVLKWANFEGIIGLYSPLEDNAENVYTGFDLEKHKQIIEELKATHFFAAEFIENINEIYLTLDEKLKNGELEWFVGELAPFGNGANPWCNCQDVPYDNPNPWDLIEIEIIDLGAKEGELYWKWGNLEETTDPGWKKFRYRFRVVKENMKWKISYLEGFDFDELTGK